MNLNKAVFTSYQLQSKKEENCSNCARRCQWMDEWLSAYDIGAWKAPFLSYIKVKIVLDWVLYRDHDLVSPDLSFFWDLPNTGSTSEFSPSFCDRFIQASALILSPTDIAWQNIMYNAKDLVQLLIPASWSASSNKELLLSPTLLLYDIISGVMTFI